MEETLIDHDWPHTKQGRNDPCYCGSGKKYKKCCLTNPVMESENRLKKQNV